MTEMSVIPTKNTWILALDEGWATTSQAEHGTLKRVSALGLRAVLACTHFQPSDNGRPPRVAVIVHVIESADGAVPGARFTPGPPASELESVLAEHLSGHSGRAFVFPGMAALERIVTVEALLAESAVDDVVNLGGVPARATDRIDTQQHLRPEFNAGRLVLRTRPSVGVDLVPFEQPDPTPCCASHC